MPINVSPPVGPAGPAGTPAENIFTLVAATSATSMPHTTFEVFGASERAIDSDGALTRTFYAVASAPAGFSVEVRLVDLTAGGTVLVTLTTASVSPVGLSGVFASADATMRVYSVETRVTGGVPADADRGYCYGAYVKVA